MHCDLLPTAWLSTMGRLDVIWMCQTILANGTNQHCAHLLHELSLCKWLELHSQGVEHVP